eukprot:scaffold9851_cov214-Skeletonema_marinoi.AAC.10
MLMQQRDKSSPYQPSTNGFEHQPAALISAFSKSSLIISNTIKMVASNKYTALEEDDNTTSTIMIPTDNTLNPADREIDLRHMDEKEVKSLQKSVLQASLRHNDVNYSDIASLTHAHPSTSQGEDDTSKVFRRTRFSFECHPGVLMEDLMGELGQELDDDLSLDYDDILSMFGKKSTAPRSTKQ